MNPSFLDKGEILAKAGSKAKNMYIIFSGMIEIYTIMDNGTEFVIERLISGSVINPTAFLVEDEIDTIFRAGSSTTIFTLNVQQFVNEIVKYPDFSSRTALRISDQLADRENSIALDYILGNQIIQYSDARKGLTIMDLKQSDIARKGLLALKNAIFHFILKEREERKVPKLRDILNKAIE
jgi:CRP-like cAMP-binding protein